MKADIEFKRYIKNDPLQEKEIYFTHNGGISWYLNGDFHREDGPAMVYCDGRKWWWLEGKRYCFEKKYLKALKAYKNRKSWEALKEYKLKKSKQTF